MEENENAATDATYCEIVEQNPQADSGETNTDFARPHTDRKLRNSNTRSAEEGGHASLSPAAEDGAIAAPFSVRLRVFLLFLCAWRRERRGFVVSKQKQSHATSAEPHFRDATSATQMSGERKPPRPQRKKNTQ